MAKGKLVVLVFIIVVAMGTLFFYMGKKNKQGRDFSANKTEAAVTAKEGEKVAEEEDSAATMKPEPVLGKKEIHSSSKSQGSKKEYSRTLAVVSERQAKEREYELNQEFEAEARDVLPLLSIQTNNPLDSKDSKTFGPPRGEIWVRVKPDNAGDLKQIMEELADLYRSRTGYEGAITIMHWVGGRPHLKMTFPANAPVWVL
ncbi:MAG: hypothetical protein JRJ83_13950 [Deltaproteobacteria bacterium]|nr:hypothetical protein [Deltaproteobacteria bacterium]MBW1933178.1 hypothetical protein [Deltaproteobacteria bacterium]